MKRALFILLLAIALPVFGQVPITNDTMVITWSDSFARAQFGNRQNFFLLSYYVLMHPTNKISPRDHSRSGGSDWEMLTNRIQKYGYPDWSATQGRTNVVNFFYVSANAGPNSNTIRTNFIELIEAPARAYNKNAVFTNDWPQSAALFTNVIIGDAPYWAFNGSPNTAQYNLGAVWVAGQSNLLYVDSFANLVHAVTNWDGGYPANSNLFFNAPNYDHPGNAFQLAWALTTLTNLNEETNVLTAVLDWNSTTTQSQTNHCVISGQSRAGGTYSFTFHADRMGPAYYFPDASQTNDSTGGFSLMPGLTNAMYEVLRVTNCPSGIFNIFEDGVLIATIGSDKLSAGINLFTDVHVGALWNQKKEFLGQMCDMVNINRTNVSELFQPAGNQLLIRYESYAEDRWATNSGMSDYITLMSDREAELQAEDVLIHNNAQQTNHTFTVSLIAPRLAPFHK